ncbi:hypothetical protein D3C87_348060 [compost metagenome]
MEKTLKEQIQAIQKTARDLGKSDEFCARAIIFWMEWHLDFSLSGNGWLDNDADTIAAIEVDDEQIEVFKHFMQAAGIA